MLVELHALAVPNLNPFLVNGVVKPKVDTKLNMLKPNSASLPMFIVPKSSDNVLASVDAVEDVDDGLRIATNRILLLQDQHVEWLNNAVDRFITDCIEDRLERTCAVDAGAVVIDDLQLRGGTAKGKEWNSDD